MFGVKQLANKLIHIAISQIIAEKLKNVRVG